MSLRRTPARVKRRALIVGAVATIAGATLLVLSAKGIRINAQTGVGAALVLAGIVGLLSQFAGHAVRLTRTGRAAPTRPVGTDDRVRRPRELYERAAALAETLEAERKFETTVTSGWTAGLTPAPGVAFGATGSVSKKILPMSLYELAEQYSTLVHDVGHDTPLLICIDGLDKCSPATDIEQILFDLRAFLSVPRCSYLIALAEDLDPRASSRVSLIDEVIHCELLTVDDANRLIDRRVLGLPLGYAALCFTVSAGRPRDLLRATKLVVEPAGDRRNSTLATACQKVVAPIGLREVSEELRCAAWALPSWAHQERLVGLGGCRLSNGYSAAHSILEVAHDMRKFETNDSTTESYESELREITRPRNRSFVFLRYAYRVLYR